MKHHERITLVDSSQSLFSVSFMWRMCIRTSAYKQTACRIFAMLASEAWINSQLVVLNAFERL